MDKLRKISAVVLALAVLLPQYSCDTGSEVRVYYAYDHDELWWAILSVLMYVIPLALAFVTNVRWSSIAGILAAATALYFRGYQVIVIASTLLVGWWVGVVAAAVYLIACAVVLTQSFRR